jgi:hypothetical protein
MNWDGKTSGVVIACVGWSTLGIGLALDYAGAKPGISVATVGGWTIATGLAVAIIGSSERGFGALDRFFGEILARTRPAPPRIEPSFDGRMRQLPPPAAQTAAPSQAAAPRRLPRPAPAFEPFDDGLTSEATPDFELAEASAFATYAAATQGEEPDARRSFGRRGEQRPQAQERAIQERAIQERAIQERAAQDRALQERALQERAAQERAAQERAAQERLNQERLNQERAAQERRSAGASPAARVAPLRPAPERAYRQETEVDAELDADFDRARAQGAPRRSPGSASQSAPASTSPRPGSDARAAPQRSVQRVASAPPQHSQSAHGPSSRQALDPQGAGGGLAFEELIDWALLEAEASGRAGNGSPSNAPTPRQAFQAPPEAQPRSAYHPAPEAPANLDAPPRMNAERTAIEQGEIGGRPYRLYDDLTVEVDTLLGRRGFDSMEAACRFVGAREAPQPRSTLRRAVA